MIDIAFGIVAAAALIGAILAVLYARGPEAKRVPWPVPAGHGVIGAVGLAVLASALRHGIGLGAARMGVSGFGITAAVLIGVALLLGLVIAATSLRGKRPGGAVVAIHAAVAIAGFTLLLTIVALA
ncbi:MAG: hypothetical protein ACREFD_16065 [Stellaceae bacterium]